MRFRLRCFLIAVPLALGTFIIYNTCRTLGQIEQVPDGCTTKECQQAVPNKLVFSFTTTKARIDKVKPTLDSIIEKQTRPPDTVYLAVPPDVVELPSWLETYDADSCCPGRLQVLRMKADYGPASKLLAALQEGGERSPSTVVVYGDDDVLYGKRILQLHLDAQRSAKGPSAFGTRRIAIGNEGSPNREQILEATGSVSVRASALPPPAFAVTSAPDACRLSDDYWISHHLSKQGVDLRLLDSCRYDFAMNSWPRSCGEPFHTIPEVEHIGALSQTRLDKNGKGKRSGGDWQDQLRRYETCQGIIGPALKDPEGDLDEYA